MYNPLVSIVIPLYNGSNFLGEAIDSALKQTYKNIEIIVINDGSTDEGASKNIALSYGDKIRYFEKENGGCASALNFGMKVMKGDWFSWLSHDDVYLEDKVKVQVEAIEKFNLDAAKTVIACNDEIMNGSGEKVYSPFKNTEGLLSGAQAFTDTLIRKNFNGCGLLINKITLGSAGFIDESYKHLLDREYWMRIALAGNQFFVVDEVLVKNRVHNAQITVKQRALLADEEVRLLDKYVAAVTKNNVDFDYAKGLCFFSYKTMYYNHAKALYIFLKSNHALKSDDYINMYKYKLIGKAKRRIGPLYRRLIRK